MSNLVWALLLAGANKYQFASPLYSVNCLISNSSLKYLRYEVMYLYDRWYCAWLINHLFWCHDFV
jgi:hypothetical protein